MAAEKITITLPLAHSAMRTRLGLDQAGSENQPGPSTPTQPSSRLSGPTGLSSTMNERAEATTGTIDGRKNRVR